MMNSKTDRIMIRTNTSHDEGEPAGDDVSG
jgi:hypothetical protein